MAYVEKYAIKVDGLNLFFTNGGWRASIEDATKFDTIDQARNKANSLNKPGLVIITVKVPASDPNRHW